MSLQKFCRKPVARISADVNIIDACRMLEERNVGCLIVELARLLRKAFPMGVLDRPSERT